MTSCKQKLQSDYGNFIKFLRGFACLETTTLRKLTREQSEHFLKIAEKIFSKIEVSQRDKSYFWSAKGFKEWPCVVFRTILTVVVALFSKLQVKIGTAES